MKFDKKWAAALLLLGPVYSGNTAQDEEASGATNVDSEITVIGTRTERSITDVAANVSVITSDEVDEQLARDINDLVRYEPGVSVDGTGSRFGLSGFRIRGIGGNRVLTVVDGVRVADQFSFGPFLNAQRDFVDVDSLKRVEIARGPISSLYGSDAMGGVVAFTTKGPMDYLTGNQSLYAGFKAGYTSVDEGTIGSATLAAGNDTSAAMLLLNRRDSHETDNQGSVGGTGSLRELADPRNLATNNAVAAFTYRPSDNHAWSLSFDHYESRAETQIFSDYGARVFGTLINVRDADDERTRNKISAVYEYTGDAGFADYIRGTVYHQDSDTVQLTREQRTRPSGQQQRRIRDSLFEQEVAGAALQFGKGLQQSAIDHYLTYGVDYHKTDSAALRNGETRLLDGSALPEFTAFPTRDFPLTDVTQIAVYLQDELSLMDGRLKLSPGLRYDQFDASASADAIYLAGNPGTPLPEDYDDSEVTARLGLIYEFNDEWSGYLQYAEGFRAPPYDDVNVGFTNPVGRYKTIPNPDLTSERSVGFEGGLRWVNEDVFVSLGFFKTRYEDFIASFQLAPEFLGSGGMDPADGFLTFQSINLDDVDIEGVELSSMTQLRVLGSALDNFTLRVAAAYAKGEDKRSGDPINSIEPLNGVIGIGYQADSERWTSELVWTLVDGKKPGDIDPSAGREPASGYGVLDLLFMGEITEAVRMNVGLFNLTDREYIRWGDTVAIGGDASRRFTQPGFNAGVSLTIEL